MRQKIDAVPTTTRSAPEFERQLPTLRAELDQQRHFRTEQLQELAVEAAEAVAGGDQSRLCRTSTPRCSGWRTARTEFASAAPSRSHGSGWKCCR